MKKLASLLVLALVSAVFVACGSDEGTNTTTTNPTNSEAAGGAAAAGGKEKAADDGGGGEGEGGESGAAVVKFEADPNEPLAYTSTEATAEAGEATIEFTNPQALGHDVAIEDSSGEEIAKTDVVADGSASTSAKLKPGTYTFYCSVPGHREGGMEGTLTVK